MTTPTPPAQDGERERPFAYAVVREGEPHDFFMSRIAAEDAIVASNRSATIIPLCAGDKFATQSAELAALRAQVAGLRKDAARYQWVRETLFSDFIGEPDECRDANRAWDILESGGFEGDDAELDSCIDAALAPPQPVAKETKP